MTSPWAAVGAETDPLGRARQLQRSWEHLLAEGGLGLELPAGATSGLRPTVVESLLRSLARGLDPTDLLAPIQADESEVTERDSVLGTYAITKEGETTLEAPLGPYRVTAEGEIEPAPVDQVGG